MKRKRRAANPPITFTLRIALAKSPDGSGKTIASGDATHKRHRLSVRVVGTEESVMCARILSIYADHLAAAKPPITSSNTDVSRVSPRQDQTTDLSRPHTQTVGSWTPAPSDHETR